MKALLVSDTHFANFPEFATYEHGVNSRFIMQLDAFETTLEWGLRENAEVFIHLGDVFHTRGRVEPEIVNLVKSVISRTIGCRGGYTRAYMLTGNHDITMEGPIFNTAHILDGFHGIQVVYKPTVAHTSGDKSLIMMPFMNVDAEKFHDVLLDSYKGRQEDFIVLMHQSVFGAVYGRDITKGVQPSHFKNFAATYCGHIHRKQKVGPIHIVGSLYPMNFGDGPGQALLVDLKTGEILKRRTPDHPEFKTVEGQVPRDLYNFFRVLGLDPKSVSDVPSNMRFVPETKRTHVAVRFSGGTDETLLRHYVEQVAPKDATARHKNRLVELGMHILKGTG